MIDLHMHSTFSDGSLTPEELVESCSEAGLSAAALTDHDSVGGVDRFLAACQRAAIRGVTGVEISVDSRHGSLHLLGYMFDHHDEGMQATLQRIGEDRSRRNHTILENLNALGMGLEMPTITALASGDIVGRPHFAKALLSAGHVSSIPEAFDRFLGTRGSCYVPGFRFDVNDAIAVIHAAGGLAVLAHPVTLRLGVNALREFVSELAEAGLDGLEVHYSEHNARRVHEYGQLARAFDLVMTGGSDFHGDVNPAIRVGRGFGSLNVHDAVFESMEARVAAGLAGG